MGTKTRFEKEVKGNSETEVKRIIFYMVIGKQK